MNPKQLSRELKDRRSALFDELRSGIAEREDSPAPGAIIEAPGVIIEELIADNWEDNSQVMSRYILLNFATKSESGSKRKEDYYTKPLNEQYADIQKKYPKLKDIDFRRFIQICFNVNSEKNYFISTPNCSSGSEDDKYFNNIIIRPEKDNLTNQILPENLHVILIGDVNMRHGEFNVKGIEFIDGCLPQSGEKVIRAIVACAFKNKSFPTRTRNMTVPDYGFKPEDVSSAFTRDEMLDLTTNYSIVPDVKPLCKIHDQWKEYIKFREYYLAEQSKNGVEFDKCEVVKGYVLSKTVYRNNPEKYDEHILDNLEDAKKDEQVVVTKEFKDCESFPLVKIVIDKNKKELFEDCVENKNIPKFEQMLKRFTRAELSMVSADGKRKISLDERYRLYISDIEPDYTALENKYKKLLEYVYTEINERYQSAVTTQVEEFVNKQKTELKKRDNQQIAIRTSELANLLQTEIAENKDENIVSAYKVIIDSKVKAIKDNETKLKNEYNGKIEKNKTTKQKGKKKNKDNTLISKLEEELKAKLAEANFENQIKIAREDKSDLKPLYEKRNKEIIADLGNSLKIEREKTLNQLKQDKISELEAAFAPKIKAEKEQKQKENTVNLEAEKAVKKENETIRRYYAYFKILQDTSDKIEEDIDRFKPIRLMFNTFAEEAKIRRQSEALDNFFKGYVKNPFLATYLFAPKKLKISDYNTDDLDFDSHRLNDKQQEAVRKAVASESIFLLQGPPGTGKTEVIAELTAQLVAKGKKVLISSETHKAIDNVFERLPKIPEIRPLRLIPQRASKETNYSPEKLVDNFYTNICAKIGKKITHSEHFYETKQLFGEDFQKLQLDNQKLAKEKNRIAETERQIEAIKNEIAGITQIKDLEKQKLQEDEYKKESSDQTLKHIKWLNFTEENEKLQSLKENVIVILKEFPQFIQDVTKAGNIYRADIDKIREEIALLTDNPDIVSLQTKRAKIRNDIANFRDENEDIIAGHEDDVKALQKQLKKVNEKIKSASNSGVDIQEMQISKIIKSPEKLDDLISNLLSFKEKVAEIIKKEKEVFEKELEKIGKNIEKHKDKIKESTDKIKEKNNDISKLKEDVEYDEYRTVETDLKQKIATFFEKFDIIPEYPKGDIQAALDIVRNEWEKLEKNFKKLEQENNEKLPVYRKILNYIQEGDTIEDDRKDYTKKLFDRVNVFGITCTSRDNFNANAIKAFQEYGIDGLSIKQQGIDVVIIDEVSKSSFLDLLIPILHGKTVILVGDHRQLPPMYDLRNLREDDLEGLDHNIINKSINTKYTELYEKCFFKTLFECVPDHLRVMLDKQYRCHEHIMQVFNHFYGDIRGKGSLKLGLENQNDLKQHGLTVRNKRGKPLIESNKHIYFIDCGDSYEKFGDSTSATNDLEAQVISTLAKQIDDACGRSDKFIIDRKKQDRRLSMGVICTYGDQARLIKQKMRKKNFSNISELQEEKFIVSTVDDFQGDERDIIFVSMVRNPEPRNRARTKAEFVKKFERINVALSRARRILIIVGSKDFLSEARIDLPDMSGTKALDKKGYAVYSDIIRTIAVHGEVLKANDIIEEGK
ncbi:MAG: AAA family ATPase [Prevotellaceae bacterium]|jgi:hypothetical protein|nr:AAA family ATPase [Prevotellaceae bacterium]